MKNNLPRLFLFYLITLALDIVIWHFVDQDTLLMLNNKSSYYSFLSLFSWWFESSSVFILSLLSVKFQFSDKLKVSPVIRGVISLLATALVILVVSTINSWIFPTDSDIHTESLATTSIISFITLSMFYGGYMAAKQRELSIQETALINQQLKAKKHEVELLKLKSDNHLVLNSLAHLSSMIDERPEESKIYLSNLISLYRFLVIKTDADTVKLQDELDFAKYYSDIVSSENPDIHIEFDDNLNQLNSHFLPPVSIQSLIDNAVKHNKATRSEPLIIKVSHSNGSIVVENKLNKINTPFESTGQGLSILNERFNSLHGSSITITEEDGLFRVVLPIISANEDRYYRG